MRRELVASILFTGKPKRIGSMNIPNIRLLNQQLVASQFTDVHDLVSHVGMLQAQEYRMMRWAVGIRMKRPSMAGSGRRTTPGASSARTFSVVRGSLWQRKTCVGC